MKVLNISISDELSFVHRSKLTASMNHLLLSYALPTDFNASPVLLFHDIIC